MKNAPILILTTALLSAGHLFAAEEGAVRIQIQPGGNAPGGGALGVAQPGAQLALNPFGGGKSVASWYVENVEKTVPLTPQQKEAMTKIIETRDKAMQEFQAKNGEKLQAAMKAMTDAYQSKDKDAIAKSQKDYQEASAETRRLYQQSQTDLDNVLTPEQKTKRQEAMTAQTIKSLTDPAVLTEEQTTRIKGLLAKGNTGGERMEREWYQSIQDVLTPEQKAVVARHRALANAKAGFGRANLTADQWQKVEAAYDELAKTPNLNAEAVTKQLAERVNGLLTAEQKEAMKSGGWGIAQAGAAKPGAPQVGVAKPGAPQGGAAQFGVPQLGAPGQPINRAPGSPQIIKFGEGGEGISITISEDGKVSTQGGIPAGNGRTFILGEGRGQGEKGTWLGITTEPVSDALRAQLSLAKGEGLLVGQVISRSPAAAAGLMQNDVLVRLDDQIIVELSQLKTLIAMKKAGDHVKLVYVRKAARQEATATLAEHEIEASERFGAQWQQAVPGQAIRLQEGHEAQERLGQAVQQLKPLAPQLKPLAPRVIPETGNRSNPPVPGASLNPNPWKQREPVVGTIENLRRQLENSGVPAEAKEKIRKSIEQATEATEKARAALDEALKQAANIPQGGGFRAGGGLNPSPLIPAPKDPAPLNPAPKP